VKPASSKYHRAAATCAGGKVAVKLTAAGTYSICETVPPNGYWNAQPACTQIPVATGEPVWTEYFVNPEAQVYKP